MANARLDSSWQLDEDNASALARGTHTDSFAVLGPHDQNGSRVIRTFLPGATQVEALRRSDGVVLARLKAGRAPGLFENVVPGNSKYRLRIQVARRRAGDGRPLLVRAPPRRSRSSSF